MFCIIMEHNVKFFLQFVLINFPAQFAFTLIKLITNYPIICKAIATAVNKRWKAYKPPHKSVLKKVEVL